MRLWLRSPNIYEFQPSITIEHNAYETIKSTVEQSPRMETGGILIGHDQPNNVHITYASMPGPNAVQTPTKFLRDNDYCKEVLFEQYNKFGTNYVGEWHSHVVNLHGMSFGDCMTLASIMHDPDYNFESFAIIVATIFKGELRLTGYIAKNDCIQNTIIKIKS